GRDRKGAPPAKHECELHVRDDALKKRQKKQGYLNRCEKALYEHCGTDYTKMVFHSDLCNQTKS
ncbi:hypothetical protein MTO96_042659, partial [Rhipicephalus appendiculatus]